MTKLIDVKLNEIWLSCDRAPENKIYNSWKSRKFLFINRLHAKQKNYEECVPNGPFSVFIR